MLHILLLILKIIGIILAVILGIVILLACIVLFVPVRYEIVGKCGGTLDSLKGRMKVTWFLHLVRSDVCYKNKGLKWRIRIAWIKKGAGQENSGGRKDTVQGMESIEAAEEIEDIEGTHRKEKEKDEVKEDEGRKDEVREAGTGSQEAYEISEGKKEIPEKCEESGKEPEGGAEESKKGVEEIPEKESGACKEDESTEEPEDACGKGTGIIERLKEIVRKIKGLFEKIKNTWQNIRDKIKSAWKSICDKIRMLVQKKNKIVEFIRDEAHVGAFRKVKKEAFKLLRRLNPSVVTANLRFGFEDPCTTGQALAGLSMLYPFIGEHVEVTPDFENRVLQGDIYIKGRIYGYYFFILCWNLIWCKYVRKTFKDVKNFKL